MYCELFFSSPLVLCFAESSVLCGYVLLELSKSSNVKCAVRWAKRSVHFYVQATSLFFNAHRRIVVQSIIHMVVRDEAGMELCRSVIFCHMTSPSANPSLRSSLRMLRASKIINCDCASTSMLPYRCCSSIYRTRFRSS